MLIPYFCLSIPMIFADLYFKKGFSYGYVDVLENLECFMVQNRYTTLWFLSSLIVINMMMYPVIHNVKKEMYRIYIILFLFLSGISLWRLGNHGLPWNFDAALVVSPFFYIGYELKGCLSDRIIRTIGLYRIWIIVIFLGVGVYFLNELNCKASGMRVDIFYSNYNNEGLSCFVAALGIEMMTLLSRCYSISIISYIGRNSLLFFAWHQCLVLPFLQKLYYKVGLEKYVDTIPVKCLSVILILCVITLMNEFIVRSKIKFIIGR